MFRHAGAYPLFPVFLLSNRVGKMSSRPRKSERNSLTLSAGVWGIGALTARGGRTWISGSESNAASSARRAASRCIASACCVSSVTRQASSCAMARCNASRLVPPADGWSRQIRPCSGSSCMSSSPGALVTRRVAIDRVDAFRLSSWIFKQNHMLMIASLDRRETAYWYGRIGARKWRNPSDNLSAC